MTAVSNTARAFDAVFLGILIVCVLLLTLITAAMVFFIIKFRHKPGRKVANIHGNAMLEVVWTAIPVIIVLVMFWYGYLGYRALHKGPSDAFEINVVGQMWMWTFTYPNGIQSDVMRVPSGQPVKAVVQSLDVIHGFFVPAFRMKQDAVPGRKNPVWFTPTKPGKYDIMCTVFCGQQHSGMHAFLEVMPKEEFARWYTSNKPKVTTSASADKGASKAASPSQGESVMKMNACFSCHSTDGSKLVGPTYKGVFGSKVTVVTDGKERVVTVDEDYIRRSMLEPNSDVLKGFQPQMPSQKGKLSEADIQSVIAYIKTLK